MSQKYKKTQLFVTTGWTCDGCGRDNICYVIAVNPEDNEEGSVLTLLVDGQYIGDYTIFLPELVECRYCEKVYSPVLPDEK